MLRRMPNVVIETDQGNIEVELDEAKAPKSVANFLQYVDAKHYDGTIFHRVIKGFMAQGGGYDEKYEKRPTKEAVQNEADNGLKNSRGTVAEGAGINTAMIVAATDDEAVGGIGETALHDAVQV